MKLSFVIAGLILSANVHAKVRPEPIQPVTKVKGLNSKKVELGKKLFFERRLSKSGKNLLQFLS